jgi:hypothetical protein
LSLNNTTMLKLFFRKCSHTQKQQHLKTLIQTTNMTKDADTRITIKSRESETTDRKNGHRR